MGRTHLPSDVTIPIPSEPYRPTGAAVKRFTVHSDPSRSTPPIPSDRRSSRPRRADPPRGGKKGGHFGWEPCFYWGLGFVVFCMFVVAMLLPPGYLWRRGEERKAEERRDGEVLRFVPGELVRRLEERGGLEKRRLGPLLGIRKTRLGLVMGAMKKDSLSLILLTLAKNVRELGYSLTVFASHIGEARSLWEQIGYHVTLLDLEKPGHVDWSIFDGMILSSLESKHIISSLLQEPFSSVPLIWIIQEDTLAKRLPVYIENGWTDLISNWKSAFSRADVIVFPDFSLPMLHNSLEAGNFFVITGSPVDVWAAELYLRSHSKDQLRKDSGFDGDDLLIVVIGSPFFYDEFSWDYAATMHALGPQLAKFAKMKGSEKRFKFAFICGNSTDGVGSAFQEIASHLGFPRGSVRHYGLESDVNEVLLMADILLYASFQDEQSFPPLLLRAMSFGVPIIAPDLPIIKKYVVDKVNGLIYHSSNIETLTRAFTLLISDMELSELGHAVASSGKFMSRNILASDCLTDYIRLLENVVTYPSDAILPHSSSQIQHSTWEWDLFEKDIGGSASDLLHLEYVDGDSSGIVYSLEDNHADTNTALNSTEDDTESSNDFPTDVDWEEIGEIEVSEDVERREMEELEERTEKTLGSWENIYNAARKSEKKKFESNERDEGELERIGRPLCIYEIYSGEGAWPFLHRGAIYRGVSLSKGVQRSKSDDIDAVERLHLLSDKYYRDLLCELGGMFSIANKVDTIHKIPWIGFQSWRAVGREVSLSATAEKVLEETVLSETKGDVMYFWAKLELGSEEKDDDYLDFWSVCDVLNGGSCRFVFDQTFRNMYGLSPKSEFLPPMPGDSDYWATLHSWVMPTPSFLEFIMFSRMFVDTLHNLNSNSNSTSSCLLGASKIESKHCYCRLLELLVNVWCYHSARKMVYINPSSGVLKEQHPIDLRKGQMWVKYFNFTLLKSMDEDLAEEADDGIQIRNGWLWPLTGEVHWKGVFEREREEKYRKKKDKHRKTAEKLIERQKYGYKQKALGG